MICKVRVSCFRFWSNPVVGSQSYSEPHIFSSLSLIPFQHGFTKVHKSNRQEHSWKSGFWKYYTVPSLPKPTVITKQPATHQTSYFAASGSQQQRLKRKQEQDVTNTSEESLKILETWQHLSIPCKDHVEHSSLISRTTCVPRS